MGLGGWDLGDLGFGILRWEIGTWHSGLGRRLGTWDPNEVDGACNFGLGTLRLRMEAAAGCDLRLGTSHQHTLQTVLAFMVSYL